MMNVIYSCLAAPILFSSNVNEHFSTLHSVSISSDPKGVSWPGLLKGMLAELINVTVSPIMAPKMCCSVSDSGQDLQNIANVHMC